jgi:aerobic-type carbon monoxide dehydrogenase small subunit (CoxS/CutS family)
MNNICIKINGKIHNAAVSSDMTLLDFLREDLKLKGTKEGCNEGECGACTVILNGNTVNSCLLLVAAVDGASVITIEGVSGKEISPIQKAFIEVGAVQCGYCTPGMVLSAKAILDKNPRASEEESRKSISGNLCRCTGYEKIVEGIILAQSMISE